MTLPWFRCYSETLRDRKIEHISRRLELPKAFVVGVWNTLLMLANDSPIRGVLLLTENVPLTIDDLEFETGLDRQMLERFITEFQLLEMVMIEDGVYHINNWSKRQYASDDSTGRVRRWREKQKCNGDENDEADTSSNGNGNAECNASSNGDCNVTVTLQQRYSNEPDTDYRLTDNNNAANAALLSKDAPETPPPEEKSKKSKRPPTEAQLLRGALLDHFCETTGLSPPTKYATKQKLWWGPLLRIAGHCDNDVDRSRALIEWVIGDMDREKLTIKTPASIEANAVNEQLRRIRMRDNGKLASMTREQRASIAAVQSILERGNDDSVQPGANGENPGRPGDVVSAL